MNDLARRWDLDAVRAGIGVCLILAIPLTLIAAFVDSGDAGLNALFFFGAMFGFVLGSGCAAWLQRRGTPLSHGIVTALVAYLGAQAVFITIRLIGGNTRQLVRRVLHAVAGDARRLFGGLLGSLLQARGVVPSSRRSQT